MNRMNQSKAISARSPRVSLRVRMVSPPRHRSLGSPALDRRSDTSRSASALARSTTSDWGRRMGAAPEPVERSLICILACLVSSQYHLILLYPRDQFPRVTPRRPVRLWCRFVYISCPHRAGYNGECALPYPKRFTISYTTFTVTAFPACL